MKRITRAEYYDKRLRGHIRTKKKLKNGKYRYYVGDPNIK